MMASELDLIYPGNGSAAAELLERLADPTAPALVRQRAVWALRCLDPDSTKLSAPLLAERPELEGVAQALVAGLLFCFYDVDDMAARKRLSKLFAEVVREAQQLERLREAA